MTELKIMQHAKGYLDKPAKGINPLTEQEVPENDVINNVRMFTAILLLQAVSFWTAGTARISPMRIT